MFHILMWLVVLFAVFLVGKVAPPAIILSTPENGG